MDLFPRLPNDNVDDDCVKKDMETQILETQTESSSPTTTSITAHSIDTPSLPTVLVTGRPLHASSRGSLSSLGSDGICCCILGLSCCPTGEEDYDLTHYTWYELCCQFDHRDADNSF